ncbi:MAG TPA: isochorismatase family cysteine hydrolase [Gaiellaceae bacterium]|nr:isochorismatase family cysteine hydrolase [Gaiellaceae bacterium]
MKALIIVDMLKDFVDGKLANPKAQAIIEPLQRLLAQAREEGWVVVFSNDAHQPDDPELKVWGEHAMAGDAGAEVIDELAPREGEIISPKRSYGAFDNTGLDEQLRERGVDEVVLTGQHTHICVRHSSYGALIRGYEITIPRDAVCAFEGVDEDEALEYLKSTYAATITTVDELAREHAAA